VIVQHLENKQNQACQDKLAIDPTQNCDITRLQTRTLTPFTGIYGISTFLN